MRSCKNIFFLFAIEGKYSIHTHSIHTQCIAVSVDGGYVLVLILYIAMRAGCYSAYVSIDIIIMCGCKCPGVCGGLSERVTDSIGNLAVAICGYYSTYTIPS